MERGSKQRRLEAAVCFVEVDMKQDKKIPRGLVSVLR